MERTDTTIRIEKKTLRKLNLLKYKLDLKSIDDVIQRMYDIITKFKLGEEMKEGKK